MTKRPRRKNISTEAIRLPPNIRLTVEPDRLEVVYISRNRLGGLWPLFFGSVWTIAIVNGTITEIQKGTTWSLCFFIPFYLVSFFFLGVTARIYFHRERLRIDDDGLDWQLSAIVPIYQCRIPWDRLVAVQNGCHHGANALIGGWGVGIETNEKSFYLFLDLDFQEEGRILKHALKEFIENYRSRHGILKPTRSGETNESKLRRRDSLCLLETPEFLEIAGVPGVRREVRIASIVWMTGWTIGCVVIPFGLLPPKENMPLWAALVILVVFWSSWLFAFPVLLLMSWRWETLRIDRDGAEFRIAIRLPFLLLPIRCRRVLLRDLGLPERYEVDNGSYRETGIEIPTTGLPIRCFKTQCGTCNAHSFLNALHDRLRQYGVTKESRFRNRRADISDNDFTDSRWTFYDDGMVQVFSRHGQVAAWNLGATLFAAVFINGIISLAVAGILRMWINGEEPVFLCMIASIFIFPFLLFGLWAFLAMVKTLLQLACRYSIVIGDQCVRYRRTCFGIGWSRPWNYSDVTGVSIKRQTGKLRWHDTMRNPELGNAGDGTTNPYPFYLQFFRGETESLGTIPDLLEGEARVIAEQIRRKKGEQEILKSF